LRARGHHLSAESSNSEHLNAGDFAGGYDHGMAFSDYVFCTENENEKY
jgi:hypothetical protein